MRKGTGAAIGLAAVGAGLLVARFLRSRLFEDEAQCPSPPDPNQLIGQPESHKSAERSAQILGCRERPM